MKFENRYSQLGPDFFSEVEITPLQNPRWLIHSESAFQLIDPAPVNVSDYLKWFNGEARKKGDQRLSHVYSGHQFGVWAGQLGDGRALSLGEVRGWEIQLKGSGITPYSRFGDGKAVIRSCLREFLASEAMPALNIPTTRALAVLTGEAPVEREQIEKEAVCVRLLPSNVRFGTFEHFASKGDRESLRRLVCFVQDSYFPEIDRDLSPLLGEIVRKTAELVSKWQGYGFSHGVMNTDNMSILGVTLDYGPYGFMENFDFNHICNHSDHQGRYSYGRQPAIALWNLQRLAAVFNYLDENLNIEQALSEFIPTFEKSYFALMSQKLGVEASQEGRDLIQGLLIEMHNQSLDYTSTLRRFSEGTWDELKMPDWISRFKSLRRREGGKNPIYVLKNYVAERAIRQVEDQDQKDLLEKVFEVLQDPYTRREGLEWWSDPSPEKERNLSVSCSS